MQLIFILFLFVGIFENVDGVKNKTSFVDIQKLDTLVSSSPKTNLLGLVSDADPTKVNGILSMIDELIAEAKKSSSQNQNEHSSATNELNAAIQALHAANVESEQAVNTKIAAEQRLTDANTESDMRLPQLQTELETLLGVKNKLHGISTISTSTTSVLQLTYPHASKHTRQLISILADADPQKVGKVIEGVDELIASARAEIEGLQNEINMAQTSLEDAQQDLVSKNKTQQIAMSRKRTAQSQFDNAAASLSNGDSDELRIFEEIKQLLNKLL